MAGRQSLKLFVGNIPWTVSGRELRTYFSEFGSVANAKVFFDHRTGISKGFGFVQMNNQESFNAISNKVGHHLEGSILDIQPSKDNPLNRHADR